MFTKHDGRNTRVSMFFLKNIADIDEDRVISSLGVWRDGWTDRHDFGILIWKHVDIQKISTQSSKLGVSCRSLYASPDDMDT